MALFQRLSPEATFWKWFVEHEDDLFSFERDRESVFDALGKALARVNPDLTFEFGPVKDGRREFVISAGGIRKSFPAVERLASAAPTLAKWVVTKFRPRMKTPCIIGIGDVEVRPEDVECAILSNGRQLGLYVFMKGYCAEKEAVWKQIGYLFLDQTLGEYDVEMKVGPIEVLSSDAKPDAQRIPIAELPDAFDKAFAKLAGNQN